MPALFNLLLLNEQQPVSNFFDRTGLLVPTTATAATATAVTTAATTTAATTTAATTTAATTTTATTTTAVSFGASFIDIHSAAIQILAIHFFDGLLRLLLGGHFHESESSGLTAESILHYIGRFDLAKNFKSLTQLVFGCLV